jgi:hypothetical protein
MNRPSQKPSEALGQLAKAVTRMKAAVGLSVDCRAAQRHWARAAPSFLQTAISISKWVGLNVTISLEQYQQKGMGRSLHSGLS